MNKSKSPTRRYFAPRRAASAEATRARILGAARMLILKKGIDEMTIAEIAESAGVAESTVFATLGSKEGILRTLMEETIFGDRFRTVRQLLDGTDDPVELIALTPKISRAIYESERNDLGSIREISGFSRALRDLELEFDRQRLEMQRDRVERLFQSGKGRSDLSLEEAGRILWMYTSRDVYRMLVVDGGWTGERYEDWLRQTLLATLVKPDAAARCR